MIQKLVINTALIVFIGFILCSCKINDSENSSLSSLKFIDSLSIPINPSIEPSTFAMQYKDGSLYWLNDSRNTISKFSLKERKAEQLLKYDYEGPNGVGNAFGFFLFNEDSILIPATKNATIHLLNKNGEVFNKFSYHSDTAVYSPTSSYSRMGSQFISYGDQIVFLNTPFHLRFEDYTSETLRNYVPFLSLSLGSGAVKVLSFRFSDHILKENKVGFRSAFSAFENKLFVKHFQSRYLYIHDLNTGDTEVVYLNNDLLNNYSEEYERESHTLDVDTYLRIRYKHSLTHSFVYDPFQKLYYEFGWPGDDIPVEKSAMEWSRFNPYFVINIYNENFEFLGDHVVQKNTYLPHLYFVNEKGLNLIANHPDNPNATEDAIRIHTFRFVNL